MRASPGLKFTKVHIIPRKSINVLHSLDVQSAGISELPKHVLKLIY